MRIVGPLVVIAAILLFIGTMLLAIALTIAVPLIALLIGLALVGTGNVFAAFAVLRGVGGAFLVAGETLVLTLRALAHPLRPARVHLRIERRLPRVLDFASALARELQVPSFDDAVLVAEANFGVAELKTDRGRRRVLVVGAPLLFVMTVDELRAVLAHELAHVALRHTAWASALGRWREMFDAIRADASASWHPISLSLRLSAWMFGAVQASWARNDELAADRFAAEHVGAHAITEALRRAHDAGSSLEVLMAAIAGRTQQTRIGPESWTEAAYRMFETLPPQARRNLRVAMRDDLFDVDGRTHPPSAVRIGALANLRTREPRALDARRAIALLPDVLEEERRLTRELLPAKTWVPARDWQAATEPRSVQEQLLNDVARASGGYHELELD
jgi:Zn-dependent protease with chaperone function